MVKYFLATLKLMPKKLVSTKGRSAHRGWKDIQSKRQTAKLVKLALTVLAIFLGILILSQTVKFTQMLFTPWKVSDSARNYTWNGDFTISIALLGKDVSLLSYNSQKQQITVVDIPQNTYLKVPHGFGNWQISSIYDLGPSLGLGGGKLMKDTLGDFFGLPIDGFIKFSGNFLENMRKNPLSLVGMLPDLTTDLTPLELIRLNMGFTSVRFDKIKRINLEEAGVLRKDQLADGTDVLIPDEVRVDGILADMVDLTIQSEHKTIAVFNSTLHPGLAQKAARLIGNIGGDVIIVSNSQQQFKDTKVVGEQSKTLDRLRQIFGSDGTIDPQLEDLVSSRANINIFLGEDFIDK